jgi:adenosylcobalamin-dependent ribonucleoside-triphosphate reductase
MVNEGIEFRLTDNFLTKYKRRIPDWGPLGYFTFKRSYARKITDSKSEEWWQTLRRVVEGCFLIQKMHCDYHNLPWNERQAQKSAQKMYSLIWDFKFIPAGRGLWSMGTEFVFKKGSACLNNCGFVSTNEINLDFSAPFVWLMDMSLLGVGVGFDTKGREHEVYLKEPRVSQEIHVVEDSREGWVEIFRRTLDAFSGKDTLPAEIDYSEIRAAGEPIKTFGGIAPGPAPLMELIDRVGVLCQRYLIKDYPVDSTLIVDLMNAAGAAVVAGGIRRTAEIAFGDPEDDEFINLKNQENIEDESMARWASNNSLMATVGMDYEVAATHSAVNGEPGFFWLENARAYGRIVDGPTYEDHRVMGCNPCCEQSLESFELCNLVETMPSRHNSLDEYLNTLKYAYLYAKTVSLIPTHDPRTNAVMQRNRRIGLSQSGIVEQLNTVGFREHIDWCEAGYAKVKEWDKTYSDWFCIPRSRKTTSVKPSGTVSLLPGVTPGIHYPHSEYYIRRIQISRGSDLVPVVKEAGYNVEPCASEETNTMVIEFPVHENNYDRGKDDISMWEQLELAAAMQAHWADNQVSITVTVRPEEAREIPRALAMYENRLKAVSFLPLRGDEVYEQPVYEKITEAKYKTMVSKLKKVRYNFSEEDRVPEVFCDSEGCVI